VRSIFFPPIFFYTRFIGDRQDVKTPQRENFTEENRRELILWTEELKKIAEKGTRTYVFFGNRYAGHAPGSVKLFHELWHKGAQPCESA
jgi:uncharacterized protein YecE (DUF72 family)